MAGEIYLALNFVMAFARVMFSPLQLETLKTLSYDSSIASPRAASAKSMSSAPMP